jgi:hypothetical protein
MAKVLSFLMLMDPTGSITTPISIDISEPRLLRRLLVHAKPTSAENRSSRIATITRRVSEQIAGLFNSIHLVHGAVSGHLPDPGSWHDGRDSTVYFSGRGYVRDGDATFGWAGGLKPSRFRVPVFAWGCRPGRGDNPVRSRHA